MDKACDYCEFMEKRDDIPDSDGVCRRFPPSIGVAAFTYNQYRFPCVSYTDWCGEFKTASQYTFNG